MSTTTIAAAAKLPPTDTGRCGEPAGHSRHRRRNEAPCRPCVNAHTADKQAHRSRIGAPRVPAGTLPERFAWLAGLDAQHDFRPLWSTMGAPQCADCLGWYDDVRHYTGGRRG